MTIFPAIVIFFGTYLLFILAVFVFIGIYTFSKHKIKDFSNLFFAFIVGFLLARFSGLFYQHLQPFVEQGFKPIIYHAPDNSFPSDHAVIAGVFGYFLYAINKSWGSVALIFAILIAWGRVLGGVHYPIDVIAGLAIGFLAVIISNKIFSFIRGYNQMGE